MRSFRSLFSVLTTGLALTLAAPTQAQQIGAGTIVGLRAPNGGWLSASDNGFTVSLAPHAEPAAWEQWEVGSPGCAFKSFHGTCLLVVNAASLVSHGAYWSQDPQPSFFVTLDPNGARLNRALASGDKVIIAINYPAGTPVPLSLSANGSGVSWAYTNSINNWGEHPERFTQWTVVVPTSPASGRTPVRAAVVENLGQYKLVNNNGRLLSQDGGFKQFGPPILAMQGGAGPWLAFGYTEDMTSRKPIVYGSSHLIQPFYGSGHMLTGLPSGERGTVQWGPALAKWTILDPSGRAAAGARVPEGVPVCIKMEGADRTLSADPGNNTIYPSITPCNPSGTWEHWKISSK